MLHPKNNRNMKKDWQRNEKILTLWKMGFIQGFIRWLILTLGLENDLRGQTVRAEKMRKTMVTDESSRTTI